MKTHIDTPFSNRKLRTIKVVVRRLLKSS